ncbi:MAG: hypothetical protein QM813_06905 [Verrucomicrobiota bacterium]
MPTGPRRWLTNDPTADAIRGEALAWKRREAMAELIETNPERALQLAAPFSWHRALPNHVTRHFEQWIDARGDLEVAMAESATTDRDLVYRWAVFGEQRYHAFVHGRRVAQISQQNIPLHGITLADKIALTPEPIRQLDPTEAEALEAMRGHATGDSCAVCGRRLGTESSTGDIGGETRRFCNAEHAELANESLALAAYGSSSVTLDLAAGGSSAWTQGRKDVLYMRVNFPDDLSEPNSETAAYDTMVAVNAFYTENSYNQTWLDTTVTPLLTLPQIKASYATAGPGALLSDARAIARKAAYDTANYDRDIVSHTGVPGFDSGRTRHGRRQGDPGCKATVRASRCMNSATTPACSTPIFGSLMPLTPAFTARAPTSNTATSPTPWAAAAAAGSRRHVQTSNSTGFPTRRSTPSRRTVFTASMPFDTSLRTSGRFYAAPRA